jgi:hypothetical protein
MVKATVSHLYRRSTHPFMNWIGVIFCQNTMFLGFDVYHCANRRGASVGALVASTSANVGQYYSTVSFHKDKNELSSNLCGDISS